ncbi:hypothetical protein BGZ90_008374, partial [Linnemannia elongata]
VVLWVLKAVLWALKAVLWRPKVDLSQEVPNTVPRVVLNSTSKTAPKPPPNVHPMTLPANSQSPPKPSTWAPQPSSTPRLPSSPQQPTSPRSNPSNPTSLPPPPKTTPSLNSLSTSALMCLSNLLPVSTPRRSISLRSRSSQRMSRRFLRMTSRCPSRASSLDPLLRLSLQFMSCLSRPSRARSSHCRLSSRPSHAMMTTLVVTTCTVLVLVLVLVSSRTTALVLVDSMALVAVLASMVLLVDLLALLAVLVSMAPPLATDRALWAVPRSMAADSVLVPGIRASC